tara:strand:+ start:359 stop:856 length:498 start_codon:yes stop_codon:yes gene_type:complete
MPTPLDLSQSFNFNEKRKMQLTKLEKEIIQHRLDCPDAMSEVLVDDEKFGLSYAEGLAVYDERLDGLLEKLLTDAELDKYEIEAIRDIATDKVYADMANDAIGSKWEDGRKMTPQWASRIFDTNEQLSLKLLLFIAVLETDSIVRAAHSYKINADGVLEDVLVVE